MAHDKLSERLFIIFSVGDDFSFDDAVAQRYGCEVHSFDPRSVESDDND